MNGTRRFFVWDLVPVVLCLTVSIFLMIVQWRLPVGDSVTVTTPTEHIRLPLSEDTAQTVSGENGLTVTVRVENGTAWVEAADCPDQVCVHTGMLSDAVRSAVCLPAGVTVTLESGEASVDGVAR